MLYPNAKIALLLQEKLDIQKKKEKEKKNGLIFLKNARTEYSSFNPSFTRVALVHIITAPD